MERTVDICNFLWDGNKVWADVYCDGLYVVRLADNLDHMKQVEESVIPLYNHFRAASFQYLKSLGVLK